MDMRGGRTRGAATLAALALIAAACTNGGGASDTKSPRPRTPDPVAKTPAGEQVDAATATTVPTTVPAEPQTTGTALRRALRVRHTRDAPVPGTTALPTIPPVTTLPAETTPVLPPVDPGPGPGPGPSGKPMSSQQLIAAAREAGDISYSQSLLYRAYALFWDPRLPAAYDGTGSSGEDDLFTEARARWGDVDPAIQPQLAPFLERPPTTGGYGCPTIAGSVATDWRDSGSASPTFKVWACATGDWAADIDHVRALLDELYPVMADRSAMGDALRDEGTKEAGGDDRIDVYLLDVNTSRARGGAQKPIEGRTISAVSATGSLVGSGSSTYIALGRPRVADADPLRRTVIHDLFHALEYAHNFGIKTVDPGRTPWFFEASAAWAEWQYFRSASAAVHRDYFVDTFLEQPSVMLEQPSEAASSDASQVHPSGAYLWPYFMQQEAAGDPAPVFAAWRAAESARDWNAFHAAVDSQQHFATSFRDFILRNLNQHNDGVPGPAYADLDPNFPPTEPPTLTNNFAITAPGSAIPIGLGGTEGLAALAAQYDRVTIAGSGIGEVTLDFHDIDAAGPADITVLTRANDGTWTRWDVTPGERLELCFATAGEDVESLYVIVGNHARVTDWATPDGDRIGGGYTINTAAAC
jgi:hypothetical protein